MNQKFQTETSIDCESVLLFVISLIFSLRGITCKLPKKKGGCSQPSRDGWLEATSHWDEFMSGIHLEWIHCEGSFTVGAAPFLTSPDSTYCWKQQVQATSNGFNVRRCSNVTEANALAPVNGPITKENERESSKSPSA